MLNRGKRCGHDANSVRAFLKSQAGAFARPAEECWIEAACHGVAACQLVFNRPFAVCLLSEQTQSRRAVMLMARSIRQIVRLNEPDKSSNPIDELKVYASPGLTA